MEAINSLIQVKEIRRFARFAAIGVVGTLVDFGLLVFFKELLGFPVWIANTLSYSAGIANNFILNRLWTFSDAREKAPLLQFAQFAAISLVGLLLNTLIVTLLAGTLETLPGLEQVGYIAAKVIATGLVLFWNFFANRYWTFRDAS